MERSALQSEAMSHSSVLDEARSRVDVELDLVQFDGGIFQMGGAAATCDAPVRKVMVVPFSIDRSLMSRGAYQRFLDENPGEPLPRFWETPPLRGPGAPVVGVSWYEARRFAEWAGYRLLSEVEWEHVTSLTERPRKSLRIRGLFEKVVQWLEDDWHASYEGAPADSAPWLRVPRGMLPVVRGTAWCHEPARARPSLRTWDQPQARLDYIGFRLPRSET